MNILIIGAGYVGLVTAACFSAQGNHVKVVEKDPIKIEALQQGKIPFYEPGLEKLVTDGYKNKTLTFTQSLSDGLQNKPELIFCCVGTPSNQDGSVDLSFIKSVMQELGESLQHDVTIVNKSTVPLGTAQWAKEFINELLIARGVKVEIDVASNPEFLREGNAIFDFMSPDRIVIGVTTEMAKKQLSNLYRPFLTDATQFIVTSPESAELAKYAANAMLATRISFMNQMACFADHVGADIKVIEKVLGSDKRIGSAFLQAGIGYGGSCFPKDVKALISMGQEHDQTMSLLEAVDAINTQQRFHFAQSILTFYENNIKNKTIGIWGLAFKPETDDIRYAPALDIIRFLQRHGAKIIAYDPVAMATTKNELGDSITYASSAHEVVQHADCLVLCTDWKEFLTYSPEQFAGLKDHIIFDGRNCLDPLQLSKLGVTYIGLGRKNIQ